MAKDSNLAELEIARIILALPRVDPKTGRRPRGSLTPAHQKLLKRLNNLVYSRDHKVELATKGRQYYAAKMAALGRTVKHHKPTPSLPKHRKVKLLTTPKAPKAQPKAQPKAKQTWLQWLLGSF